MGEVYKARDTRLGRDVAIKVLPSTLALNPFALERFNREARAIASVSHPHICAIYDVGEQDGSPFLVMEFLDGDTLDARIKNADPGERTAEQVIEWGLQLAGALEAAHARGIVHRDLKPSNVIVASTGDVKVLDFGIAKLVDDPGAAAATTAAALTMAGVVVGTASYMAPEQVRGDAVDQRADLFALGAVLYEVATGKRAFSGPTTGVIADAILNRPPAPIAQLTPGFAPVVVAIISKLLEKDRELRYRNAEEVRSDLRIARRELHGATGELTATAAESVKSVVVLPFRNVSGDAEHDFFSDGITEDLIDALGRTPGLRVTSRATAFRFRDPAQDVREIGAALGVTEIVEGRIRRAGDRLRVSATLVEAATGFQRWSERYDRDMKDLFEIQDEIVSALAAALTPALMGQKRAVRRPTDNLEAYEFYLKGRHYWHQRSPSTLKLAIQSFERAIQLDADYALAYAGLADSWALYRPYGWLPIESCQPQAQKAVRRAMELAPEFAEVQFAQALHMLYFEPHWRESEPHFKRAIELNPRWSLARVFYGVFLAGDYRLDEARVQTAAAIDLDALSPFIHGASGMAAFAGGDVPGATAHANRALELQPDFLMGAWLLAIALDHEGRLAEAEAMIGRTTAMSRAPIFVSMIGKIYAREGRMEDCARIEAELDDRRLRGEYIPRACDVILAVGKNDVVALRRALQACIDEKTTWLTVRMGPGPSLETFRSDPEVNRLLDQIYDHAKPGAFRAT